MEAALELERDRLGDGSGCMLLTDMIETGLFNVLLGDFSMEARPRS